MFFVLFLSFIVIITLNIRKITCKKGGKQTQKNEGWSGIRYRTLIQPLTTFSSLLLFFVVVNSL